MARPLPRPFAARARLALTLGAIAVVAIGCATTPGDEGTSGAASPSSAGGSRDASPSRGRSALPADFEAPRSATLSSFDRQAFEDAWRHFLDDTPGWPGRRRAWLARGEAAGQVLAENLFRYFWSMSSQGRIDEVTRVAEEARHVGAPAVPWFGRPLLVDSLPLREPLRVKVEDPDDPRGVSFTTIDRFVMDDTTRRDAATVLAAIGEPSIDLLARADVLRTGRPATRRQAARALGRIGGDRAVDALIAVLVGGAEWQDRAAIVEGLGDALPHPRARDALGQATRDPDAFVRRKAEEALVRGAR